MSGSLHSHLCHMTDLYYSSLHARKQFGKYRWDKVGWSEEEEVPVGKRSSASVELIYLSLVKQE